MTKSPRRVHDRTGGPAAFKTKVVLEALKGAKTLAQLSTEFGIHAQQITDRIGGPVESRFSMGCPRCSAHLRPNRNCPSNSAKL